VLPLIAAGVVDAGGAPSLANISVNFPKKFEITPMLFSGAWGKMIYEKNQKQKICDTVPLIQCHITPLKPIPQKM
jgi:hypothetical protein